ncbi:cadaverine/lysine antiporter [Shimwellia blattae]|uniref:Lysine/cadaverine transport protein n=1 Tax=Shimwellia blattae (strain ATCC 29907 / DSM 4481 / JCM 1650 / NBRC 105725 / CDC 9005-74) TaxID=630626 RepID=I2B3T3_SHIBC|nr:cadaverine/lysine antiporter [Shimwellia blattae]AFJ45187.1 lysine/cadaverine transport protein [Shimwellia blattae DSM 4481 = NBRC 105725]GAB80698.1 putative cadaverine/lysine antiporter [Shimwellia blattae DSM 4481 = NBRC 105725]VDY62667.1 Arginine/agmatine antiporter [Shimwellia blattae]VEC19400.1 Arginine/agmatine antiporter [Shimwellia blattae]
MASSKQIGLIACTGIVAGNMMGSGIALLPANLAQIGSIALFGWIIALIGALSLAYVFARLATRDPQVGGPIAYAGRLGPAFGFQTAVLYYHANWIGNLADCLAGVAYLSVFFPALNHPIPAGIASIVIIWIMAFVNMLGGNWVSRLTTVGLVLVLIPVFGTAIFGWYWFDPALYQANWNTSGQADGHVIMTSILICLWAFVGVESASVSSGLVKNPKRTVPLATLLGTAFAGIVYILATQVMSGMFPASVMAVTGAPFASSAAMMVGNWAAPVVSAFTAFACLAALGSWMMMVGQAGVRAAQDGNFPKIYGETDSHGVPRKGIILSAIKMSLLMAAMTFMASSGSRSADIFGDLIGIAVLLTMLPYFYSCVALIRLEGARLKHVLSLLASLMGCLFCFVALSGAESIKLTATFIISLTILIFWGRKLGAKDTVRNAERGVVETHKEPTL